MALTQPVESTERWGKQCTGRTPELGSCTDKPCIQEIVLYLFQIQESARSVDPISNQIIQTLNDLHRIRNQVVSVCWKLTWRNNSVLN